MENINQIKTNPLIEKDRSAIPGVTFRLPSKGKIYGPGVLSEDIENGEVTVFSMRLREELKMKSVDAILQGTAVSETIQYCVPQVVDPMALAPEDVDYLITAIKKMTHGSSMKFRDTCMKINDKIGSEQSEEELALNEMNEQKRVSIENPENFENENAEKQEDGSEENKEHGNINNLGENSNTCEFNISLDFFINNAKEIDIEKYNQENMMDFKNFKIEFHPITFKDFKELNTLNLQEPDSLDEKYLDFVTDFSNINISKRIKKVDDIEDPEIIHEWVETLSLANRKEIFDKIAELQNWGIDFKYTLKCETCGKEKKTNQSYINPLYFFLTY